MITPELEFYESKIQQIMEYIESINLGDLNDRMDYKETKNGGSIRTIIASKEQQAKSFMEQMEKLPKLLNSLDDLRNKYAEKAMLTRGDIETEGTILDDV